MKQIDWNTVKFRASSWGSLLTEPQSKADREAGVLSKTCQGELIKLYNQLKYGRKRDITTKQMEKGRLAEEDSITLLCRVEKKLYHKNQQALENEWATGHPDLYSGESIFQADEVDDIKTSWDLDTFMPKLLSEPDPAYEAQLNVYYSLTGAKGGHIIYALVSAPIQILEQEKKKLLFNMNVATEYAPEYLEAAAELEKLMIFEDIPIHERIIKHYVPRNDELIQKMQNKVPRLRKFLAELDEKHSKLNK